jgi:outer membrane murein-binding lipoprotein Lpp
MKSNFFLPGILTPNRGKATRSIFAGVPLLATALLSACSTIATYDQVAYEHATNAKVDTLALMDKATTPYAGHIKDIEAVHLELAKAAEYDNGRPLNRYTIESWNTLLGDNGILNRFLMSWKKSGSLSSPFINDKKAHVAREFDDIIQLESGKIKAPQGQ